jgi:hypothetical protein
MHEDKDELERAMHHATGQVGNSKSDPRLDSAAQSPQDAPGAVGSPVPMAIFDSAIKNKSASFEMLVEAAFQVFARNVDSATRQIHKEYYPKIVEAFEARHGRIDKYFFALHAYGAAAVLTEKAKLFLSPPWMTAENVEAQKLLSQCDRLRIEVEQLLWGRDRRMCLELIYGIVTLVFSVLQPINARKRRTTTSLSFPSDLVSALSEQLADARAYFERSASRAAQILYTGGMLGGGFMLFLLGRGFLDVVLSTPAFFSLFLASAMGSVGAVVSVMSRMALGKLSVNYEAGRWMLVFVGVFRPIMGAILAGVLYLSVASGIVPLAAPTDSPRQLLFYSLLGFLGGFSERWVQDMLTSVAGLLPKAGHKR